LTTLGELGSVEEAARSTMRTRLAARAGRVVGAVSRVLKLGDGTVVGGRTTLTIDPDALARLGGGHPVALVTGTNGKTTTTRLLAAALGKTGPVVSNTAGSNMASGLVATLSRREVIEGAPCALEVDEGYLSSVAEALRPLVVVLLNLTRDQLDRVSEVRMLAGRWRGALAGLKGTCVVANADDPIVVWAAQASAGPVTWVAAGQPWRADSTGCPECEGRIDRDGQDWRCLGCSLCRPSPDVELVGDDAVSFEGSCLSFSLALPGRFNRANAVMAASAARILGVDPESSLRSMAVTTDVAGRYEVVLVRGAQVRLLLAKNPAGWVEMFDLMSPSPAGVVLAINARTADGRDPSWIWDVPFERLAGRSVVVTGERAADLAVRLHYAGVDHSVVRDQVSALSAAAAARVDYVGNYTAFQDLRQALRSNR
jgi:lipid II isoglutaminyl synthase (glutamine-hydrolysing)